MKWGRFYLNRVRCAESGAVRFNRFLITPFANRKIVRGAWAGCLCFSLSLLSPAYALSDNDLDQLADESTQMRELMTRMQTRLQAPARAALPVETFDQTSGFDLSLGQTSAWAPASAMLGGSLQARWARMIEQGVLGRFADSEADTQRVVSTPPTVRFVAGEELPWYGSVRLRGPAEQVALNPVEVQAQLMVVPRFDDGSFLHVGISYHALDMSRETTATQKFADDQNWGQGDWRRLGMDLGYIQDSYSVQARYMKLRGEVSDIGLQYPHETLRGSERVDVEGFYIQGAWRIAGEPLESYYAPGLLAHIEPRDEEGIWEVVVRYANLGGTSRDQSNVSDSMLLGVHWRAGSSFKLQLDYIEGSDEASSISGDGGLSLRGTLSF